MAKNESFEIEVCNWEEYNPKEKRKNKKCTWFRIEARLARSPKYLALSSGAKLLWLAILSEASEGDPGKLPVVPAFISKACNVRPASISGKLRELESVGWIRIVAAPPSRARATKRYERNDTNETNNAPSSTTQQKNSKAPRSASRPPKSAAPLIAFYCDSWKARYESSSSPTILPHHAKMLKTLREQTGEERARQIVENYLKMPDTWFVTKSHDIPTLMGNLNKVIQFMETGRLISKSELRDLDTRISNQHTLDLLESGELFK